MGDSPEVRTDGALQFVIKCDGEPVQDRLEVHAITIHRAYNTVPWARLDLLDGELPTGTFPVSDETTFAPGAAIQISGGYGQELQSLFEGVVVRHGFRIASLRKTHLVLECRDKAAAMTIARHCANFIDQTDGDICAKLIRSHALVAEVSATGPSHKELVQFHCTDWDFMLARAEATGLLVNVKDGKVTLAAPDVSAEPALTVAWGMDLMEFDADVDARTQYASVKATSWDPKTQGLAQGDPAGPDDGSAQGNLKGAALAKVMGGEAYALRHAAPLEKDLLNQWAKAAQLKAGLARIQGRMRFQGNAKAEVGCLVKLTNVGQRFAGNVLVTSVKHELVDGDWITEVGFGMGPDWHLGRREVQSPAAAGLLPGVGGLQVGVVLKVDADPQGEQRIQVKVPVMEAEQEGVWARLLQLYASKGFGTFFLPEVGDEVVLGYLNDDPSSPVILGSVYSSNHKPPYELAAANDTKALVTRCHHTFEFDEKNKTITLTTPGKNKVVLDDTGKRILIQDQNNNKVELSEGGIVLDSPSSIKLTAKGTLTLEATGAIAITSKADVKASGLNVACEGQVGFSGKGSATAELSASGQTTVKGAMVMIN